MSRVEQGKRKVRMGRVAWDRASCSHQRASKQDGDSLRLAGRELYAYSSMLLCRWRNLTLG